MVFIDELQADFREALKYGSIVRFRYFTPSFVSGGSSYDDDITLSASGNDVFVSGLFQSQTANAGFTKSHDSQALPQGRVLQNYSCVYVESSVNTSGLFSVGLGSPPAREYSVVPDGIVPSPQIGGSLVYKKIYLASVPIGSLIGL